MKYYTVLYNVKHGRGGHCKTFGVKAINQANAKDKTFSLIPWQERSRYKLPVAYEITESEYMEYETEKGLNVRS